MYMLDHAWEWIGKVTVALLVILALIYVLNKFWDFITNLLKYKHRQGIEEENHKLHDRIEALEIENMHLHMQLDLSEKSVPYRGPHFRGAEVSSVPPKNS